MDIGLVTVAYNNYGKFIGPWLGSIDRLNTKPKAITIVLGRNHGLENGDELIKKYSHLPVQVINTEARTVMGIMRNIGVQNTKTEWIMCFDVDDIILPHAIDEFSKHKAAADYISTGWIVRDGDNQSTVHKPAVPRDIVNDPRARGKIIGHSPYRRTLWERNPYPEIDYHNYRFVANAVEAGARFVRTTRPCVVYQRRPDSHSRTILPRPDEKLRAVHELKDMVTRVKRYYARADQ